MSLHANTGQRSDFAEGLADALDAAVRAAHDIAATVCGPSAGMRRDMARLACAVSGDGRVFGHDTGDAGSAHANLLCRRHTARRNDALRRAMDALRTIPGIYVPQSSVMLRLDFTAAGSGAIDVRIEGLRAHPRPLTPRNLSRRIEALARDLASVDDFEARRVWCINGHDVLAGSPQAALWKYLALSNRAACAALRTDGTLPSGAVRGPVYEVFERSEVTAQLARRLRAT